MSIVSIKFAKPPVESIEVSLTLEEAIALRYAIGNTTNPSLSILYYNLGNALSKNTSTTN